MNKKQKIAIISFSDIPKDGRVLRQIQYLSTQYEIDVIGYGDLLPKFKQQDNIHMFPVAAPTSKQRRLKKSLLLPLGKIFSKSIYEYWYWKETEYQTALQILKDNQPRIIHANDWESVTLAVEAARNTGAKIVADLHEYAPLMRNNRWYWRTFYKPLMEYFLHKYGAYTDASITVGKTIADRYREEYDLDPIVVMNTPGCTYKPPYRATNPDKIHLIHHGNATRDRNLETMIETIALAEQRYELNFMLIERDSGYINSLKELANRVAPKRVHFHTPVQPNEIVNKIAEFDMGFYLMPAVNFNQSAALPNKFFEFVMAGLAICIGPSQEMARLTKQFNFGMVAPSFKLEEVANLLNQLTNNDIDYMKQQAIKARKTLNADVEMEKLINIYRDKIGRGSND